MRSIEPIPISALQHAVYCMRQAAVIHIERLSEENRHTVEGRVLRDTTHEPGERHRKGVRRVMALPIACRRLNLAGVADLVECQSSFHNEPRRPGVMGECDARTQGAVIAFAMAATEDAPIDAALAPGSVVGGEAAVVVEPVLAIACVRCFFTVPTVIVSRRAT